MRDYARKLILAASIPPFILDILDWFQVLSLNCFIALTWLGVAV